MDYQPELPEPELSQTEILKAEAEKLKAIVEPLNNEKLSLQEAENDARIAYHAMVAKIREDKASLESKTFDYQRKLNQINADIARLEREEKEKKAQDELEAKRKEREADLLVLNEKWDKLTIAATWREMAKDHQIDAGHYITENRNVILADPMGLGKTLSSIITVDMAEAATRNTSPEWPFLGEYKKVYDYDSNGYVEKLVNTIERPVGKRILYFCPSSLIRNVEKEFHMWAKHRNVTHIGGMTKAEREYVFNKVLNLIKC